MKPFASMETLNVLEEDIGVVNVLNISNMLLTVLTSEGYHGKIEKFFNIYKPCRG